MLALLLHLLKSRGGIAKLRDVNIVAAQIHKRSTFMCRILNDHHRFRVTPDALSFYSPYLRETMKLAPETGTDDYCYHGIRRCQTEQKTASSMVSQHRDDSSHHAMANTVAKNENADNQAVSARPIDIEI